MKDSLHKKFYKNAFVHKVRTECKFDDKEYASLCDILRNIAIAHRKRSTIDRSLAIGLYEAPQIVRNMFLRLNESALASKLEDAWVELDRLVRNCFV